MITFDAPCCDQPLVVETPLPEALRCDSCAVTWQRADPEPAVDGISALAALAA